MNYVNYEKSIIQKYRVKLVGWPDNIKFTNPASLPSVEELEKLRQALRTHSCRWIKLSERDLRLLGESIAQRESPGEAVGRKRKQRSDKGKPRKKVAREHAFEEEEGNDGEDGEDDEASGPSSFTTRTSHLQTRSKSRRLFKSREIIQSDEE